jgi:hypothetical protein
MSKIDWANYEKKAREIVRSYRDGRLLGTQAVRVLDELLAATTGRGEVLLDILPWESASELRDTDSQRAQFWEPS